MTTGDQVTGTIRKESEGAAVTMQARYATDIDDMWSALTEPERLTRWLGDFAGDLRVGGTFTASFTSTASGTGRIDACERPHRLLVTIHPDGGDDDAKEIEATLREDGTDTVVTIEERWFTDDTAPMHGAGWQAHVEDLLTYLGGGTPGDWHIRWTQLIDTYRQGTAGVA